MKPDEMPYNLPNMRLFPLPGKVFLPYEELKLHIFEPRYRQMTRDALAGDRLIAVGLLSEGDIEVSSGVVGDVPVARLCSVGMIESHEELPDGRFNLVLRGVTRMRILSENTAREDQLFRTAVAERVNDIEPKLEGARLAAYHSRAQRLLHLLAFYFDIPKTHSVLLAGTSSLGEFTFRMADLVLGEAQARQDLLSMRDPSTRLEMLVDVLAEIVLTAHAEAEDSVTDAVRIN